MKSSQYVDLFVDEAGLLLEQCQSCLEQLEQEQNIPELYHELFRLFHTLKGMASSLGDLPHFDDVTRLSHYVETLLDAEARPYDLSKIYLLSDALGMLQALVQNIAHPEQPVPLLPQLTVIYARFLQLNPNPEDPQRETNKPSDDFVLDASAQAQVKAAQARQSELYDLHIHLMPGCLMKSIRAILVLNQLEAHGEVIASRPDLGKLRDGLFGDAFHLLLASPDEPQEIEDTVMGIAEIDRIEFALADMEGTERLPEPDDEESEKETLNEFEVRLVEAASAEGFFAVWLNFEISGRVQLLSARITHIFRLLETQGEIIKALPGVELLEQENFDNQFKLLLVTEQKPDKLRQFLLRDAEVQKYFRIQSHLHAAEEQEEDEARSESGPGFTQQNLQNESQKLKNIRLQHLVRVDAEQLSLLKDLTGELLLARAELNQSEDISPSTRAALSHLNQVTASLQSVSMRLQSISAAQVFHRYPRMVRDLARSLDKQIHCELSGDHVEIERAYVDDLSNILLHMIRNACDHGLESPAERLQMNKPEQGSLKLHAAYHNREVHIEVRDDGRGINLEALKTKALENHLISDDDYFNMDPQSALNLIFQPGLSTTDATTDISGRGVGMDVVQNHVNKMGGRLHVSSELNQGTVFTVILPSELEWVEAVLVRVQQQYFALPLAQTHKIIMGHEAPEHLDIISLQNFTRQNGHSVPLRDDAVLLQIKSPDSTQGQAHEVWLLADELMGYQQLAVKSLNNINEHIIQGAALLNAQNLALYMEPERIVEQAN